MGVFFVKVHRTADFGNTDYPPESSRAIPGLKKMNKIDLQEVSENAISDLELSLRDDENDDYLEMDIEELKSLR